jgi:hypothetical protein
MIERAFPVSWKITGVMTQAIRTVHAGKGPWFTAGGWEYTLC